MLTLPLPDTHQFLRRNASIPDRIQTWFRVIAKTKSSRSRSSLKLRQPLRAMRTKSWLVGSITQKIDKPGIIGKQADIPGRQTSRSPPLSSSLESNDLSTAQALPPSYGQVVGEVQINQDGFDTKAKVTGMQVADREILSLIMTYSDR